MFFPKFEKFSIVKEEFFDKRVELNFFLSLLALIVCLTYCIIYLLRKDYTTSVIQLVNTFLYLCPIILIYYKRFISAFAFLITLSILLWSLSIFLEPFASGGYLFGPTLGISAFALFGYRHRYYAYFFTVLIFVVTATAILFNMDPLLQLDEQTVKVRFLINLVTTSIMDVFVIYFLIRSNFYSHKKLSEREDELIKANNELDNFLYSASHDLRAPLKSLLGLINISRLSDKPDEKISLLDMMETSIQKLDSYIDEIIDNSKNSKLALKLEKIELKEFIMNVVMENLGHKNESIKYDIKDNVFVYSDRSRLSMIIKNLVSNSFKYRSQIRPLMINIGYKQLPDSWELTIEDNGIGIKKEFLDKIFDMFIRASDSSEGSGLGLYIAKQAVNKLGGTISVKSSFDFGSTFKINLPNKLE